MLQRPVYLEINLEEYRKNLKIIRKGIDKDVKIMSVVKDDGYGLGALALTKISIEEGITYFAVSNMIEALELRESFPYIDILVLGYIPKEMIKKALLKNITLTIWSIEQAKTLNEIAKDCHCQASIEIAVDTGLSRLGLLPNEKGIEKVLKISELSNLHIKGIFSQFARTETKDDGFTMEQGKKFIEFVHVIKSKGVDIGLCHIADSAGIVKFKEFHLDMVRCGALALGSMTGKHVADKSEDFNTQPILSLKAQIARVEDYPEGTSVGYDASYVTNQKIRVVTAPIGYGDGLSLDLQGKMEALIKGKRVKQIGEICMDMLMFDATGIDCKQGDEIVFLGHQGNDNISIWDWSKVSPSSSTYLQSMLRDRIPKIYI